MPTVLRINGWRLFFYSNEGHEPPHIHAEKGGAEVKFWLQTELYSYNVEEDDSYGLSPALRREIQEIIVDHYEYLVEQWHRYFGSE